MEILKHQKNDSTVSGAVKVKVMTIINGKLSQEQNKKWIRQVNPGKNVDILSV